MSSSRVYIGHLSSKASERDVEHFFRGYGKIRDVVLKNGFGELIVRRSRTLFNVLFNLQVSSSLMTPATQMTPSTS